MSRFQQAGGAIEAGAEAWRGIAVQVSRLARMAARVNGSWPSLLLDFVDAAEAAGRESTTRPLSSAKVPPGDPATVWLSTEEVAMRMHCSVQHVRALARARRLPAVRIGRAWMFDASSVDRPRMDAS